MSDRRFTIQAETRGMNNMKTSSTTNTVRDDIQAPLTGTGTSLAIAAAAAATGGFERRSSQAFFRTSSIPMNNSRKSSMFLPPNQPRPNTYRMEPDNEYRFRPYKVQAKILEVLVEQMKDQTYNSATVNELVKDISRSIHHLMKNFQLPRYKIIIQTVIGQKNEQLLRIASRCLWDPKTDNMLSVNYETKDMIALLNVYAVYFE
jgi:hypothetical protein